MAKKRERQLAIRELIESEVIASQEDLRLRLLARGCDVTQATLSRDLQEMGIARVPSDDGPRYRLPGSLADDESPSLEELMPQWFSRIDGVGELLVLHTLPSGAQPVAEALDAQGWREVIGTIAGENTVLIICRSADVRAVVRTRIETLAAG
jgi:transcriptional regulator of arginine metabolism